MQPLMSNGTEQQMLKTFEAVVCSTAIDQFCVTCGVKN
jgi:hypothetical protein